MSVVYPVPDPQQTIQGMRVMSKVVTAMPTTTVQFTANDQLTYATDIGSFGADREDKEYDFFHLKDTVKTPGKSTIKDFTFTEALTATQLATRKAQYDDGDFLVVCFFDDDDTFQYGLYGYIKSWEATPSNKESNTIQLTLSVSSDEIVGALPTE